MVTSCHCALIVLLGAGLIAGTPVVHASPSSALRLQELQLAVEGQTKTLTFAFSSPPMSVRAFPLNAPSRLVIDVSGPVSSQPPATYFIADSLLWRVRQGSHPRHMRFVLDFSGNTIPRFVVEQQGSRVRAVLHISDGMAQAARTQMLFPHTKNPTPVRRMTPSRALAPPPQRPDALAQVASATGNTATAAGETTPAPKQRTPQTPPTPSGVGTQPMSASSVLRLQELRLASTDNQKTVAFRFSRPPTAVYSFTLTAPPRLVVDVTGPVSGEPSARYAAADPLFQRVRMGSHPSRLRFVLDIKGGRIPPFVVAHNEAVVTATFTLPTPQVAQTQVLFTRSTPVALAAHTPETPPPAALSAHAADELPAQTDTPARQHLAQALADGQGSAGLAPPRRPKKSLLRSYRERIDGIGFVKNASAYRFHSPHQFSKVQNWLQVEADIELTDWAIFTTIGRIIIDPVNHLETAYNNNTSPVGRWHIGDTFEAEWREAYLELVLGDFDVRLGRQQIVWGESIGLRILDVINPQDFREFILENFIDARIPLWGTRVDYTLGAWTLEGLWLVDFEADRPADQGSEWQFQPEFIPRPALPLGPPPPFPSVQVADVKKPQDGRFSDSEVGFRVTRFLRNMDVSLNYFHAWSDFPVPFRRTLSPNNFLVEPSHERFHLFGGAFNYAFDVFVIRGEGGVKLGQYFVSQDPTDTDGVLQREFLSYVLGFDWTVSDNLLANIQFFQNVIFNKPSNVRMDAVNNALSLFLRADFWNETLFPEFVIIYGINAGDTMIRPRIKYQFTDLLSVTVGMDFFTGSRSGFFGQFSAPASRRDRYFTGRNNRIYLEVKRSFSF